MAKCPVCDQLPSFAKHLHQYPDLGMACYEANPLARGLGRLRTDDEVMRHLSLPPMLPPDIRHKPAHERVHHLGIVMKRLFIPTTEAVRLYRAIEQMLYQRYVELTPFLPGFTKAVKTRSAQFLEDWMADLSPLDPVAKHLLVRGFPGTGKSRTVQRCLSLFTPVLYHSEFQGRPFPFQQRVAVKLDCPPEGSVRGLCLQFLAELDRLFVCKDGRKTHYFQTYKRLTKNELLVVMAELALQHGVGLLVIDEIQNLLDALVDGPRVILNFLVGLENTIGVPVLVVGTYAADELILARYHQVRRSEGEGHFEWVPMVCDEEWDKFVKALWSCQVIQKPARFGKEFSQTLYELSGGVMDLALRIFRFAQEDAIAEETESVTLRSLTEAAAHHCPLSRGTLEALKARDWNNPLLQDLSDMLTGEQREELKNSQGTALAVAEADDVTAPQRKHSIDKAKPARKRTASTGRKQKPQASGEATSRRRKSPCKQRQTCTGQLQRLVSEGSANGVSATEALKDHVAKPSTDQKEAQP